MKRLLIANRGEIAVRIIRAAREFGIDSVAVYSESDEGALHVRLADERVSLCGRSARETYLDIDKVISAAIQSGADAVHPGYGFLAENSLFAKEVIDAGLIFVGPSPHMIEVMGAKDRARECVSKSGVPVVPGTDVLDNGEELEKAAERIGYPVMLKATHGGSGRGMRIVRDPLELKDRFEEASREAQAAFGNGTVFIEKYLEKPRHIEVQIFGDSKGNVVHLGERECSLQRRHQKVVEESPAPNLHPNLRQKICQAAVNAARSINYLGAGTVEFLVEGGESEESNFYFLEMNTRLQVEHPVTEEVTGLDLAKWQLLVAKGGEIPLSQEQITFSGHAIEFRVSAEKPGEDFLPTTGEVLYVSRPFGANVREDSWVEAGTTISPYYDSLMSKLVVSGNTRSEAISRSRCVLDEYIIEGVETTLEFHRWLVLQKDFVNGEVNTNWIEQNYKGELEPAKIVGPLVLPERVT